ncbi:trypsin delta-like [Anopheles albimanus]|uniref:trypsin delta-like n=1 Tax=Anopheles albimanus TaxID=7167 RepID=UPI001641B1DA|nr:trypsin delta-like [Anopheles albimanus]XP_035790258.1 trypsin delta-like [Anopheles albimanus]XP_035790259.1 trypsin delta-like [Anopheles albimanus]
MMRQSVKLILLAVVFCAYCTKAQDAEPSDPDTEANLSEEVYQNATIQLDTKRAGRIGGGTKASIADYPYVVTVIIKVSTGIFYTIGTIISDRHVLTSPIDSSIYYTLPIITVTIRAGSDYKDKGGFTFENAEYKNHDLWTAGSTVNYVCVVTINGTFSGKANVKPIAVETSVIPVTTTTPNCIMLGWMTDTATNVKMLSRAEYQLATEADCTNYFRGSIPATSQCAQHVLGYACLDDGGPLICNNRMYGLFQSSCKTGISPYTALPATSIQSFLAKYLPAAASQTPSPRKNYMTCPCESC